MRPRDWPAIDAELRAVVDEVEGLARQDRDDIRSYIDAGEEGIALELLATQVNEYDLDIDPKLRGRLRQLGNVMNIPVDYLLGDPWAEPPSNPGGQ